MNWRVKLNGTDITAYVSGVQTRFEADAICGEVEVSLASRAPIAGLVVPRVPQSLSIAVDGHNGVAWVSRGTFFLEEIGYPPDLNAKTATLWGRSASARLTTPWAPRVNKQWAEGPTISAIVTELAGLCGVTVSVTNDFDVCQYCYAVSDQTPAEIIRDLATRSGQILWPEVDGTLTIAPRLYRSLPAPAVTLDAAEIVVESLDRQVPDFGNRVLVSGAGAVAGLSVQVVPQYPDDECLRADGASTLRVIAVVTDSEGQPIADGTALTWSATGGALAQAQSVTGQAMITGEELQADNYHTVRLHLPAVRVLGVYAQSDRSRRMNLYEWRRGSVEGNVITFASALDYFDQSLRVDYLVAGAATNIWTAGHYPGDETIMASVAGAAGMLTVHQSNPTACPSTINMEAYPPIDGACLGDAVPITVSVIQFGTEPGSGQAQFSLSGCGELSSARRSLSSASITENVVVTNVGSESQVQLRAIPSGAVSVYDPENQGTNYYSQTDRNLVILNTLLDEGTRLKASYVGLGAAIVSWKPPEGQGTPGQAPDCEATITCKVQDGSERGVVASVSVSARDCRELPPIDEDEPDLVPVTIDPCDSSTWPQFDPHDSRTWPPGWGSLDPANPSTYPTQFEYCDRSSWPSGFNPDNPATWPSWMGSKFDPYNRSTWLTRTFDPNKPSTWPAFDPYDKTTWPSTVPQSSNFGDPSTWPEGFDPCAPETWPQQGICDPFDPDTLPASWTGNEDLCDPSTWPDECNEDFDPWKPDTWPDEWETPDGDIIDWPDDFDPGDPPDERPEIPVRPDPNDPSTDPDSDTGWPDSGSEEGEEEPDPTSCTATQITMRTPGFSGGNWAAIAGVSNSSDCPGHCSCDEICSALRTAGKLGGQFYSQCVSGCTKARQQQCSTCSLYGPSTLNPGEIGQFSDGITNSGAVSGDLALVSQSPSVGYNLRMPAGGEGPFTVKVCYGADERQCCERQVNFPPCSLSGPASADWGEEVLMTPGADKMAGASAVVRDLTLVRSTDKGFVVSLPSGQCEGTITVMMGGQMCGTRTLRYKDQGTSFTITGPSHMEPGETAYFAFESVPGAKYTGTLQPVQIGAGGAILRMPAGASGSYTASWTASCGRTASMSVQALSNERCCGGGTGGCERIYFSGPVLPPAWCSTDGRWKTKGACANCSNWWCRGDEDGVAGPYSFTTIAYGHGAAECSCWIGKCGNGYYGIPLYT